MSSSRSQAAAELARNAGRLDDAADAGPVDRMSRPCSVEIDQVEIGRPLRHPAPGHGGGIGAEDRFLLIISLP